MKGDYPDDNFTETDVLRCLEQQGLQYKNGQRYILSQCPLHDDASPSAQIFKDDWFVLCHANCEGGRFHITKAFPELRNSQRGGEGSGVYSSRSPIISKANKVITYKTFDQMAYWKTLPLIPRTHQFKSIPLEVLDDLGWRWVAEKKSYYLPYFNMYKTQIPFSQLRHLEGDRRFTFLKDAKPIAYGLWNLDNPKLFIVEGASDCAVMQTCGVPWIGMPSASSGAILSGLAGYCKKNDIVLVFAGDNDSAGLGLLKSIEGIVPYRIKQPRAPYKDWGDMYEAEGIESVRDYCFSELFGVVPEVEILKVEEVENNKPMTLFNQAMEVFPGSKELKIVDATNSKEQFDAPTVLF